MRVLVLNAGSSSLKWTVFAPGSEEVEDRGAESWTGDAESGHAAAVRRLLGRLPPVEAAGHRVVHGGTRFRAAVRVDASVRRAIAELAELAPLHNPAALAGIEALAALHPDLPQVAAFDTAFHATLPEAAAVYALPREWNARWRLRRFGFHGLSVQYAAERCAALLGRLPARLVVGHLGAGCSVTAVADGRSVDTSMGFTPLEGTVMATRSGSVDPGLLLYLLTRKGLTASALEEALNERSGLLGLSGVSGDFRAVLAAADAGDRRAALAYAAFRHSLVRAVGAMVAVLGGLDALVFTGGLGEHSARLRADLAADLAYTGLRLDPAANAAGAGDRDIAAAASPVRALVIEAREDLAVLRAVRQVLG